MKVLKSSARADQSFSNTRENDPDGTSEFSNADECNETNSDLALKVRRNEHGISRQVTSRMTLLAHGPFADVGPIVHFSFRRQRRSKPASD
jgi:hypothetical protein